MVKLRSTLSYGSRVVFNGAWTDNSAGYNSQDALIVSVNNVPGVDHPFLSEHFTRVGCLFEGKRSPAEWFHYHSGFYSFDIPYSGKAPTPNGAMFDSLLARTNPANAKILLPVFWAELRDIPEMIFRGGLIADLIGRRKSFRHLIRDGNTRDLASANLAIQFGWAPFVSDLLALARFTETVEKRKKYFKKLKEKGLRSRINLGSGSEAIAGSVSLHSDLGISVSSTYTGTKSWRQWGVVHWVADGPAFPQSDADLRRRLLGLSLDQVPLNVWNALPWTWLTDYFSNVGDMLKSGNRSVATPRGGSIMTQLTSQVEVEPVIAPTWYCTGGKMKKWMNARKVISEVSTLPSFAAIPSLTGGQLSILGSLAVMKNPKVTNL